MFLLWGPCCINLLWGPYPRVSILWPRSHLSLRWRGTKTGEPVRELCSVASFHSETWLSQHAPSIGEEPGTTPLLDLMPGRTMPVAIGEKPKKRHKSDEFVEAR